MNPQHFKELLGTVMKTSGYTQKAVAEQIGITKETIIIWKKKGVPVAIKPYVVSVLREICFSSGKWRKTN
ncbi:hypothetical protein [Peribacillus acanthi]|uniref:hypothetical protein n=1 Tax=Peribacillus acanthi TaxID=2171554 RepID=UPI000D3EA7F4|nr:hypothetical protein [Peribacillus acanthi]